MIPLNTLNTIKGQSMSSPRVKDIDTKGRSFTSIKRAGIILYTLIDGKEPYFCFGIDRHYSDLSDFGGQREETDENIIHTAVREFNEESRCMIGFKLKPEDVQDSVCLYNSEILLIFLEIGSGFSDIIDTINENFTDMRYIIRRTSGQRRNTSMEMRGLCWLSISDVNLVLSNRNSLGEPAEKLRSAIFSPSSSVVYIRIYSKISNFLNYFSFNNVIDHSTNRSSTGVSV